MWLWLAVARASDVIGEGPHVELEAGFLGGVRELGEAPFRQVDDDDRPIAGLDDPFAAYPLTDALVVGPRVEARLVVPPLRVSAGWQRVYPDWQPVDAVREPDAAGTPVVSSVRALTVDEARIGIGVEAPTGLVVPFLDVVGDVRIARVSLEVDGRPAEFRSETFSLGARAGLRAQVSDVTFVQGSAEVLPLGPLSWGGSLGIGVAL